MSGGTEGPRVPDLQLERYRLGELPAAEAEALARRLLEDADLRSRLEELDRSDAGLRRRLPSGLLADAVRSRLRSRQRVRAPERPRVRPGPALAAAAAALVLALATHVIAPSSSPRAGRAALETGGDRVKGLRPALALFRKTAEGSEALADGDAARKGDLVRVGYRAAGRAFGVIVSVDGRGSATLHLPERGRSASPLSPGSTVLLPHAYELDDAPRFERFFFVTSSSPFDVSTVLEAARGAAADGASPSALRLPAPLEQCTFLLAKER